MHRDLVARRVGEEEGFITLHIAHLGEEAIEGDVIEVERGARVVAGRAVAPLVRDEVIQMNTRVLNR